ncbi:MAG: acyl-CoA dehydrogenase family protein [Rhodospirillales bacterium]|nr:MAG: acyl-CoA dehydrogenase family protein [Rhodospirillales bacterium]
MDFLYDDDERALRDAARAFAAKELAPRAAEADGNAAFPDGHMDALAAFGAMGLNLPEAFGGAGASAVGLALAVEALAAGCAATASTVTAHFLATDAILLAGDAAQKTRYLPAAAEGRALGAFALTEPGAGSDPADMTMRAEPSDGGYRLYGAKHFISNAGSADFLVVFAKTAPEAGHRGISAFIVARDTPGLSIGPAEATHGIRASHAFPVQFDCSVPAESRLGEEGSGFRTALMVLDRGRIETAALALGIAGAALEAARAWVEERVVSGQPIANFQGIRWMVADMSTELDAARLMTWRAARLRQQGERFTREAAMAKLYASEAAGRIADGALQIHGGYGYTTALPLERYVRDARILRIYEGTSEIQRNIIARFELD